MTPADPDAREVDRLELIVTPADSAAPDALLAALAPGSSWLVRVRTAEVLGTLVGRAPLATLDQRLGTCLRLRLDRPVPVEPGLAVQVVCPADPALSAAGVVRPWTDPAPPTPPDPGGPH